MFIMVEAIVHLPNSRGNDRNWWNYQCNSSILDKFMTNRVDDCTRFVKMDIVKNSYKVRKKGWIRCQSNLTIQLLGHIKVNKQITRQHGTCVKPAGHSRNI